MKSLALRENANQKQLVNAKYKLNKKLGSKNRVFCWHAKLSKNFYI